jgi:hypothetical protein
MNSFNILNLIYNIFIKFMSSLKRLNVHNKKLTTDHITKYNCPYCSKPIINYLFAKHTKICYFHYINLKKLECDEIKCNETVIVECDEVVYNETVIVAYNKVACNETVIVECNEVECNETVIVECNEVECNETVIVECNEVECSETVIVEGNEVKCNEVECNDINLKNIQLNKRHTNIYQNKFQQEKKKYQKWSANSFITLPLNKLFKPSNDAFSNYISGKKVAIVAPSKSLIERNDGTLIDSYDVIIRLNKALPLSKKLGNKIGSRTDIIYNSFNLTDYPGENRITPGLLRKEGIQFACSPYPMIFPFLQDIRMFLRMNNNHIPFHHINQNLFMKISNKIHTRPNTGISAIVDILSYNITELYLTGFTFFMDGYYSNYQIVNDNKLLSHTFSGIHNQYLQKEFLKKLVLTDSRIKIDSVLHKILFDDYIQFVDRIFQRDNNSIFSYNRCDFNVFFNINEVNENEAKIYINGNIRDKYDYNNNPDKYDIIINIKDTEITIIQPLTNKSCIIYPYLIKPKKIKKEKKEEGEGKEEGGRKEEGEGKEEGDEKEEEINYFILSEFIHSFMNEFKKLTLSPIYSRYIIGIFITLILFKKSTIYIKNLNINKHEYYLYKFLLYKKYINEIK